MTQNIQIVDQRHRTAGDDVQVPHLRRGRSAKPPKKHSARTKYPTSLLPPKKKNSEFAPTHKHRSRTSSHTRRKTIPAAPSSTHITTRERRAPNSKSPPTLDAVPSIQLSMQGKQNWGEDGRASQVGGGTKVKTQLGLMARTSEAAHTPPTVAPPKVVNSTFAPTHEHARVPAPHTRTNDLPEGRNPTHTASRTPTTPKSARPAPDARHNLKPPIHNQGAGNVGSPRLDTPSRSW
ncbi:hypothetical protein B0H16DRAFT_1739787 [Mycena metata]|uniref:Uncharacterized protein n=1 Tax=Mycena metata TaxID=1033252 RepID=A0AAD7HEC6_9AGAR|nr:hypothetical protein B0H16DRAFT_1739787 [Mycena metata]